MTATLQTSFGAWALRTISLLRVAFFLTLILVPCFANAESEPRGPVRLEDRFTLSIPRLTFSPDSARILKAGSSQLRTSFSVSNTINRRGGAFLIDSEDRDLTWEFKHGLNERLEIGSSIPLVWRGGGVLDSAIFNWHSFLGLPQGPRDDVDIQDDDYTVRGEVESGGRFSFENEGLKIGDLKLRLKYLLLDAPIVSLALETRLPTGSTAYRASGVDLLASVLSEYRISEFVIHNSIAYSFYSSPSHEGIEYHRHRAYSALHLEYIYSPKLSFLAGLIFNSNLVQDIKRFPNYQLYLDIGLKFAVADGVELEFLIRENPAPDQGSSDFTSLLGLGVLL